MSIPWRLHPTVALMALAHMMVDGYGNILAPLLPLLITRLDLSLAAAGMMTMLFQLSASVAQVGFGHLADRWRPRVLVMAGPVLSIVVLSLVGLATTPFMLAAILVVGGLGGAAFHPPAATLAHKLGGDRPGLAMSIYISGGTLGFSLGPLMFAPFAQQFGMEWTPLLALPGLAVIAVFLSRVPRFEWTSHGSQGIAALVPYAKPLGLLYGIVVLRTMTSIAFATFLPVMLTRRGASVAAAGAVVAGFLFASGVGGFFGGPVADRWGPKRVIAWSLVLSTPFLFAAPLLHGAPFMLALAIGGFFLQSTLPVNVVFGQALAPVSAATVSSLMMGFAWGTGGMTVPLTGYVADRIGIEPTLVVLSLVPLLAAALALPLPNRATRRTVPHPAEPLPPGGPST
jgi:FSR family fosmidomycin resistance protein-like MFS transporter